MNLSQSNEIFSLSLRSAYRNSVIPEILGELRENFKGIEEIIEQLEKLSYLLLLNSIEEDNKNLSNLSLHIADSINLRIVISLSNMAPTCFSKRTTRPFCKRNPKSI